ncbi:hypothetical protein OHB04_22790 [Streptomyces sp. NBC_01775]|uniref:hypothetical protein n=1 Tax=Streptomyces sp. NBC_01775 TaxID=2975939 RepID=UPI002DDBA9DE|nr:hypothetical protein [Streptomyces sp. NBC_01775]WSB78322.1 hypothetical protein OHB04_22790 [Streptomyces sp. NBC_01775]
MATNVEATRAEIDHLRVGDSAPGLAQLALTLAALMDEKGGATAKANAGRELRAVIESLRKLAPVEEQDDGVDQLSQKREARRVRARRA